MPKLNFKIYFRIYICLYSYRLREKAKKYHKMQLLNKNYSYDSFIYEIFSSRFYNLIISKLDEKYNYFHRLKLKDSKHSLIHFFHLIFFMIVLLK